MRQLFYAALGCVALAAVTAALTVSARGPATQMQPPPLALAEVYARGVQGRLGRPLGTIAEAAGQVVPNDSKSKADSGEPYFLRIDAFDGAPLDPPVLYPFTRGRPDGEDALRIGDRFRFVAYETGGYQGAPDKLFDYVEPYATTGFYFGTDLVVVAKK